MIDASPMWQALHRGKGPEPVEEVVEALRRGEDPRGMASNGRRPLHQCCALGYTELIGILVKAGADVRELDRDGETPAIAAIVCDQPASLTALALAGDDLHQHRYDGFPTLLHLAIERCSEKCTKLLLDLGFDPMQLSQAPGVQPGYKLVHEALVMPSVLAHMASRGIELGVANDETGDTLAHMVARRLLNPKLRRPGVENLSRTWSVLLDNDVDLKRLNHAGESALEMALRQESPLRDLMLAWHARHVAREAARIAQQPEGP